MQEMCRLLNISSKGYIFPSVHHTLHRTVQTGGNQEIKSVTDTCSLSLTHTCSHTLTHSHTTTHTHTHPHPPPHTHTHTHTLTLIEMYFYYYSAVCRLISSAPCDGFPG